MENKTGAAYCLAALLLLGTLACLALLLRESGSLAARTAALRSEVDSLRDAAARSPGAAERLPGSAAEYEAALAALPDSIDAEQCAAELRAAARNAGLTVTELRHETADAGQGAEAALALTRFHMLVDGTYDQVGAFVNSIEESGEASAAGRFFAVENLALAARDGGEGCRGTLLVRTYRYAGGAEEGTVPEPGTTLSLAALRAEQSFAYAPGGRDPMAQRLATDTVAAAGAEHGAEAAEPAEAMHSRETTVTDPADDRADRVDRTAARRGADPETPVPEAPPPPVPAPAPGRASGTARQVAARGAAAEFAALALRVEGVSWSPEDARALVNGRWVSPGDALPQARREGDLRVERIEERAVVFRYRGALFRREVEIFSRVTRRAPPASR